MRFCAQILGVISICFAAGCVSTNIRLPASFNSKYNTKIVTSLKSAAANGILFQVSDTVFRDVPARQVDRCRKAEPPTWSNELIELFSVLDKNVEYYNKFHIIDIKRGDKARAEISTNLSDVAYLTITYSKRENREKVTPGTPMPCLEGTADYLGKDLVTTNIDWPNEEEIRQVLKQAANKKNVEDFRFNTTFLDFLAEHQSILKIGPEVPFEKDIDGNFFLKAWLEKMAQESHMEASIDYVNDWMKEIPSRSKQATKIQFFGLYRDSTASYGVQVDTAGKFARNLNGYQEPTYLFMSYGEEHGEAVTASLKDLNQCLQNLAGLYGNPLAMGTSLESDENSFLSPGYSCKLDIKKE